MIRFVVLLLIIVISAVSAAFLSGSGDSVAAMSSIVHRAMPLVPLGIAAALVISCGDIDLSPSGMFAFFGMLTLGLASLGLNKYLATLIVAATALALGLFQGWAIAYRRLAPLITTLGMSLVLFGGAITIQVILQNSARDWREAQLAQLSGVEPLPSRPNGAPSKDRPVVQTLPVTQQPPFWRLSAPWAIAVVTLVAMWRRFTISALRHVAVGLDRDAARLAGVDVRTVRLRAFVVAALLVYVSTMLYMIDYQAGGWTAATGRGLELIAIAAAVIGGTAISGGRLSAVGVALGVGVWAALGHLCIMASFLQPEHQDLAAGLLLLVVAFVDSRGRRS